MRALLSDGTTHRVASPEEAVALAAAKGLTLDALMDDVSLVEVPMPLLERLEREKAGATHAERNATVDLVLASVGKGGE